MNTYIQDKLDSIEEKTKHLDGLVDKPLVMILVKEALTDYHNHIVEKIDDAIKNHQITNSYAEGILEGMMHCKHLILQDTNPKEL